MIADAIPRLQQRLPKLNEDLVATLLDYQERSAGFPLGMSESYVCALVPERRATQKQSCHIWARASAKPVPKPFEEVLAARLAPTPRRSPEAVSGNRSFDNKDLETKRTAPHGDYL